MPLIPSQQVFEYRMVRVLGRGVFGTVYLAHDTFLDLSTLENVMRVLG